MAWPLSDLTFYRMPDQTPAASTIVGLMDAFYGGLSSATDYRGTALPASHAPTVARFQNAGSTESVYGNHPTGSMGMAPKFIFAGATAGSGTMRTPDTWTASNVHVGVTKNAGAYNTWGNANPFTSGQNFGYWRATPTGANSTSTTVRLFISQETIFWQVIQAATTQYWGTVGAIISPFSSDTTNDGETDNRLYGVCSTPTAVPSGLLTTVGAGCPFIYGTSDGTSHSGVFLPGTANISNVTWDAVLTSATALNAATPAGVPVGRPFTMVNSNGNVSPILEARGTLRSIYALGLVQSGRWYRNGSTDLYHIIGQSTATAAQAIMLKAAA